MRQKSRLKIGQELAQMAIGLEGLLAIAKVVIGLLSGSLALISDAIHSISDLLSIITSWFGLKIAQKKAGDHFPYGYYKAENLGTLAVSALVVYGAIKMFLQGYDSLQFFSQVRIPFLAMGISLLDALILFFFGSWEIKIGRQIDTQSLVVMGKENKTHIFSSLAVLVGTLAAFYRIPYLEGAITMIISLLIFKIGLLAARDSIFSLMDVSPEKKVEFQVRKAISSAPGVEEFSDLKLRKSGPFIFGEAKIGIRRSVNVRRAHEIASSIEGKVKKKVPQIDSFTIHIEPFESDFSHLVIPVKTKEGLNSIVDSNLARSNYLLFVNLKAGEIKGFFFIKNRFQKRATKAGLAIAKLIANQKSEVLLTPEIGEISFYTLRENLVDSYQTKAKTAEEAIDRFNKGQLSLLMAPTRKSA